MLTLGIQDFQLINIFSSLKFVLPYKLGVCSMLFFTLQTIYVMCTCLDVFNESHNDIFKVKIRKMFDIYCSYVSIMHL